MSSTNADSLSPSIPFQIRFFFLMAFFLWLCECVCVRGGGDCFICDLSECNCNYPKSWKHFKSPVGLLYVWLTFYHSTYDGLNEHGVAYLCIQYVVGVLFYMNYLLTSAIPIPHLRLVRAIVVVGRNYHELKEWPEARTLLSLITASV